MKVGYLSQHAEELGAGGRREQSVLEAAQRATGLTPGRARALLGRFLFSGEEAEKPLDGLSGGERRRLSLAMLVGSASHPPNVLILDEPTNHLDIESREALEDALRAFPGAVLLVSHDRALLDAVGTRTVAVEERLAAQLRRRLARVRARARRAPRAVAGPRRRTAALRRAPQPAAADGRSAAAGGRARGRRCGRRRRRSAKATPQAQGPVEEPPERAGARPSGRSRSAEAAMRALEDELADPAAWATRYEAAKSEARHTAATARRRGGLRAPRGADRLSLDAARSTA